MALMDCPMEKISLIDNIMQNIRQKGQMLIFFKAVATQSSFYFN